jgi:hypothetical protein
LANAGDIRAIERHLSKCFDNLCGLILNDSDGFLPEIAGMISSEREEVDFL